MTFTEYCPTNNIKLQPQDLIFIRKQLKRIPKASHKAVVRRYCEIWCESMNNEPSEVKKQNIGRYNSNTYLRRACE